MSELQKYEVTLSAWNPTVSLVTVERETASSVWIKGCNRRRDKISGYTCYFDTFEEAQNHLVDWARSREAEALRSLKAAKQLMVRCNSVKPAKGGDQ